MSDMQSTDIGPVRHVATTTLTFAAGLLLAACSQAPAPAQGNAAGPATSPQATAVPALDAAPATPVPPVDTTARDDETIGGDGSPILLDTLSASEISEAGLAGELACAFTVGDTPPLLYAMGLVGSDEPAQGLVKVAGYVEAIRAPGGFDAMLHDPVFAGRGKTIRITTTGPGTPGEESPLLPATLMYQRADGASRVIEGHWQCGP